MIKNYRYSYGYGYMPIPRYGGAGNPENGYSRVTYGYGDGALMAYNDT